MGFRRLFILWWLLSWQLAIINGAQGQNLLIGYYGLTCPTAEVIVTNTVQQAFLFDNTIGAGLIRLLFHDCFVNGCDGSILLKGNNTEQVAVPNNSVRGYDVIDRAKIQLEAVCPGIVSCSDIIALATRDSVALLGGPAYQVPTGRLDGLVPGNVILPGPTDGVALSNPLFAAMGLTLEDMVILLGAHSVGSSQCQFFSNRLYNFNNTGAPDTTLNTTYLPRLQTLCPQNGTGNSVVPLDIGSEFVLDSMYYNAILTGQGVLTIDQEIATNVNTSAYVNSLAGTGTITTPGGLNSTFFASFVTSILKLGAIGIKTPIDGQVRRVCGVANT